MKSPRNGIEKLNRGKICDILPRSSILSLAKLSKPTNISVCRTYTYYQESFITLDCHIYNIKTARK